MTTVDRASDLGQLSEAQSLELLRFHSYVGRLGFEDGGVINIIPVNYLAEATSVLFCSDEGSKVRALVRGGDVTFEVDDFRPLTRSGWSVMVRGRVSEVVDTHEIDRLRRGPLRPWIRFADPHWFRISIDSISGRRLRDAVG